MKSRVSFVLSKEVHDKLGEVAGHYRKSAIVSNIIEDYIKAEDYTKLKPSPRKDLISVSFTMELDLLKKFKECYPVVRYNSRSWLNRPELSHSLEYLLKKWLKID